VNRMRSILALSPGMIGLELLPAPHTGPYEALVRVEACGICNSTDAKLIDGQFLRGCYPSAIGHESVGIVVEIGDRVRHFQIGDRVLRSVLYDEHVPGGRSTWGGMSDFGVVVDATAIEEDDADLEVHWAAPKQQVVPSSISAVQAAAMITLKETLHFLQTFGVGCEETVAIVGTGPVAQAFCFLSVLRGASPVVVFGRRDIYAQRFKALGADEYVVGDQLPDVARAQLEMGGFTRVIEAVGSRDALRRCVKLAGEIGHVRIYGLAPISDSWDQCDLEHLRVERLGAKEDQVHDEMLALVAEGLVDLDDWVSHVISVQA